MQKFEVSNELIKNIFDRKICKLIIVVSSRVNTNVLFLDLVALWNSFSLFFSFFPEQLEVHEVIYECLYVASFKSHLNPGRRVNETRDLWKFVKYCRTMQIAPQLRNEINREGYDWIDFSFGLAIRNTTYKNRA